MNVLRLLYQDLRNPLWAQVSHNLNLPPYNHPQEGQSLLLITPISLQSLPDLNYDIDTYPLRRYGK